MAQIAMHPRSPEPVHRLVAAKLRPPRPLTPLVPRPRVHALLGAAAHRSFVVVLAGPSGIGKTVALTQWAATQARPVAWVTVDARDNDPRRLWPHLAAALAGATGDPDLERSAAGPEPGSAEYVAALANRVVAHHARPILILDEYEHIVERDIHDRLELLTRVCADRLTLVVAARNRPALPVERLEPAGRLARVSWTELRFDADEARDLLTTGYGLPTALAPTAIDTETIVRELRDREEILDALLRFALGFDLKDRELFRTAFTPDAEFDFRPVAAELGLEVPVMVGVAAIEAVHFNPDVRLDTTHAVSNARIGFIGDRARLTALVEAQHLPTGDHTRHLLLKNRYAVDLVRTGAGWAMSRLYVENVWRTGDPKVLIGA